MSGRRIVALAALAVALIAGRASAHTLSDGYVNVTVDGRTVTGRIDLAARDLHDILGLDGDRDGRLRWKEIEAGGDRIRRYVGDHLALASAAGPCPLTTGAFGAIDRADGVHVAIALTARCPGPAEPLTVDYRAIFGIDARHNGLITVRSRGGLASAVARGPGPLTLHVSRRAEPSGLLRAGAGASWSGFDRPWFLIALLLPVVLRRAAFPRRERAEDVAGRAVGLAALFAAASTAALAAGALGWLHMPDGLIATLAALSVAVAALDNLLPSIGRKALAVSFGVVHGFALAAALARLGPPDGGRIRALVAFDLGAVLGLTALVAVFLPIAFAVRGSRFARLVLVVASLALAAAALHGTYQHVCS